MKMCAKNICERVSVCLSVCLTDCLPAYQSLSVCVSVKVRMRLCVCMRVCVCVCNRSTPFTWALVPSCAGGETTVPPRRCPGLAEGVSEGLECLPPPVLCGPVGRGVAGIPDPGSFPFPSSRFPLCFLFLPPCLTWCFPRAGTLYEDLQTLLGSLDPPGKHASCLLHIFWVSH